MGWDRMGWSWMRWDRVGCDESCSLPRKDHIASCPTLRSLVAAGERRTPLLLEERGLIMLEESAIFSSSGFPALMQ